MNNSNSLNKVFIVGRLGADAEVRNFAASPALTFSVATRSFIKNEDGQYVTKTTWHSVVWFGSQAEKLADKMVKGTFVCVEGNISYRKDANGTNYANIVAENVTFFGYPPKSEGGLPETDSDGLEPEPEQSEAVPF